MVEKFLEEKRILNRGLIIECLNHLNNMIPSKFVLHFLVLVFFCLINLFLICRLLENLLKKAIELNDIELCYCIINNVQLLEEYQAVDCLKYFLK